jgi:hypothetical protein
VDGCGLVLAEKAGLALLVEHQVFRQRCWIGRPKGMVIACDLPAGLGTRDIPIVLLIGNGKVEPVATSPQAVWFGRVGVWRQVNESLTLMLYLSPLPCCNDRVEVFTGQDHRWEFTDNCVHSSITITVNGDVVPLATAV